MGLSCGSGVSGHNDSTSAHANGLTTLANLYVVAGGKLGWSDAYLTRSAANSLLCDNALTIQSGYNFYIGHDNGTIIMGTGGDVAIAHKGANVMGMAAGDSIYFDHLGSVRILSGAGVPGASVVGDLYYDNTNHNLYVHSSGNWRKVACADAGFA